MSYRLKGYARRQARKEFNKWWNANHPKKQQNTGCLVPVVLFASGVFATIGGVAALVLRL